MVFGWMPHHNLLQKMEHIDTSCYQLQCCFAVMAASLFFDFCCIVPDLASQIRPHLKKKKKKLQEKKNMFALYLTTHFASAAVLHWSFCIPYRKGHPNFSQECKMAWVNLLNRH